MGRGGRVITANYLRLYRVFKHLRQKIVNNFPGPIPKVLSSSAKERKVLTKERASNKHVRNLHRGPRPVDELLKTDHMSLNWSRTQSDRSSTGIYATLRRSKENDEKFQTFQTSGATWVRSQHLQSASFESRTSQLLVGLNRVLDFKESHVKIQNVQDG